MGTLICAALPFLVSVFWLGVMALDRKGGLLVWVFVSTGCLHLVRLLRVWSGGGVEVMPGVSSGVMPDVWIDVLRCLYVVGTFVIYPVAYAYVRGIAGGGVKAREWVLFVPSVVASVGVIVALLSEDVTLDAMEVFGWIVLPLELMMLAGFGYRGIRQYGKRLSEFYSDEQARVPRAVIRLFNLYLAVSFVKSVALALGADLWSSAWWSVPLSMAYALVLFLMGYYAVLRRVEMPKAPVEEQIELRLVDEDVLNEKRSLDGEHESGSESRSERKVAKMISEVMDEEKLYLMPGLTLDDLAKKIGTNRGYVSGAINTVFGMSFCDYVNSLRVKHACKLLTVKEGENDSRCSITITEVAEESGFSSDAAFFRNFKKFTGTTPEVYRSSNR